MLVNFVQPEMANIAGYWWQQDGAHSHTARATMQILTAMFQYGKIFSNSDLRNLKKFFKSEFEKIFPY